MELTDKQKTILISAGEFELSPEATAYKLGIEENFLIDLLKDPRSQVNKYYNIGKETNMFDVFQGLKKQVMEGKTYAAKLMEEIRKNNEVDKIIKERFGI